MNEQEWLECTDFKAMLEFLEGKVSERKLRLFACACCRRIWHLFVHKDSFNSIEVGERFAEGEATDEELRLADELAMWVGDDASWRSMQEAANAWAAAAPVQKNGFSAAQSAVYEIPRVFAENEAKGEEERVAQGVLLHEIFGNPFHPVIADSSWLTPTVLGLAQAAFDNRNLPSGSLQNDRLAVLADALEDAGASGAILEHLRSEGPHVRGCFALDLVLNKE
jgi:hypothetical protein